MRASSLSTFAPDRWKRAVAELTAGWGADVVFEASGSTKAFEGIFNLLAPAGTLVLVGMPPGAVAFDVVAAQAKEARIETIFRYANVYPKAVALLASGKVDLKPLISANFRLTRALPPLSAPPRDGPPTSSCK